MFLFKSSIVLEPVCKFVSKTNYVPIVGNFFWPIFVQSHGATTKLIDAHASCYGGQINENVDL